MLSLKKKIQIRTKYIYCYYLLFYIYLAYLEDLSMLAYIEHAGNI